MSPLKSLPTLVLLSLPLLDGCNRPTQSPPAQQPPAPDPIADFIRQTDALPPTQRPPQWEQTKRLMARRPPALGRPAPDFTLQSPDGKQTIRMSAFHESRPLVLIFGSFT